MSISTNDCRFNPVQCSDATLQTLAPQEGYLYFTTDTKRIYMAKNGNLLPMCAATGFFYGEKEIEYDNSGNAPDPNVTFNIEDEIEGNDVPQVDDLILNIDGCFYRVRAVGKEEVQTERLTLQGSGVGPGGSDTPSGSASFKLAAVNGANKIFSSVATSMKIGFKANYSGTDTDNYISYVCCTMKDAELPFFEATDMTIPFNTEYEIDLVNYASNFSTVAQKSFTLLVQDKYGEERSMLFKVQLVELSVRATQPDMFYADSSTYTYDCDVNGGTTLSGRKVTYTFYNENNLLSPVKTIDYETTINGNVLNPLNLSGLAHGAYVMKVQASGSIGGGSRVESNILTHKMIYFNSEAGTPVFTVLLPDVTEQYSNIPLQALLVTGGTNKNYTLDIKLNGVSTTQLTITAHVPLEYNLMFEDIGKYTLTVTVVELAKTVTQILDIVKYTGNLPVIDTGRADLDLYLSPRGKTNDVLDKNIWISHNGAYTAQLENFYYGDINGWFIDDGGASYLKLSQGASLSLPEYKPFAKNAMDKSNYGLTVELDFKVDSVLDYDKDIIKCISTDRDGTIYAGFRITGKQAYFYTSIKNGKTAEPVTINIVEGQRIKISYVIEKNDVDFPMILAYLNGIISSVSKYEKTDRLIDASGDGATPGTLTINSDYAEVDIYGIRIYSAALEQSVVLENYQSSLGTLAEREASYKSNLILDSDNKVDLRYMEDENYSLGIPYIKLTGGYKAADKKAMTMGVSGDEYALPVGKKDFRLISFELKYPTTGYFQEKGYTNFSEMCTFESGKNETSLNPAYGETPLTGAVMYAQGTSSLEYPVKNLRIKFKSKKISIRPGMEPVDLICLKADFMESAGAHNTGAANYIDDVYNMAGLATPGQEFYSDEDIVTCIKGHPVAVFWSPSGADGTYEYIGKYNFNLDKATPEPFGFKNTPEEYDASAPTKFGWDENGENTIRCFEYLDNSVMVCNFIAKPNKSYYDTWYELVTETNGKTHYGWTEGFESRHPEDMVGENEADCIYTMASWLNELAVIRYGTKICPKCGEVLAISNRCLYCQEEDLTDVEYEKQPNAAYANARFANEYECYFNKDYLVGYYLISNMLLMIDSRTKNCMMASWGPEPDNFLGKADFKEKFYYPLIEDGKGGWVPDTAAEKIYPKNYIWYPIFYDMDTMLGIDNQGYPRLNYYDEDTNSEVFNGEDILWNFVRDAIPGEVVNQYGTFESASSMFSAATILPYFNNNQANLANEALYNGDAEYKYIDTFREGYYDHLHTDGEGNPTYIEPGKGSRLYAAQGNRSLDRQYFITNRVNFLSGKYQSSNYQSSDRIEFRCYIPTGTGEDSEEANRRVSASISEIPFNKKFHLTALGPGFAGVRFGQNGVIVNHQFTKDKLEADVTVDQNPNDLESYVLGLNNLADVGDLADKYLATFTIKTPNKLKRIILGSDCKDYYNPYWKKKKDSEVDVQSCYLLEEFNMYNCDEYTQALNFTACKQLKKLLLTGCGVTALTLPEGTVIEEMRLPDTIQTLIIKNQNFLEADKFSFGHYEYAEGEKYMENGKFVNTYNNLRYVQILNTPINSYEMATQGKNLQEYQFTGVNWLADTNDVQYCSVYEEDFDANVQYYKYSNGAYVEYDATAYESGLYEKVQLINDDGTITRIPVLERLIRMGTTNQVSTADALTGTLTIDLLRDNGEKPVVNEFDIYYRYNSIYPNLTIKYGSNIAGEKAYSIEFYRTDYDNMADDVTPDYVVQTNGRMTLAELTGSNSPAGEPLFTPVKASTETKNYTFTGVWRDWSDPNHAEYLQSDFANITPSKNMRLTPVFSESTRTYHINFYDYTNEVIFERDLEYNTNLGEYFEHDAEVHYRYRDDSDLDDNMRYVLKGWQTQASFNNPSKLSIYDLSTTNIVDDMEMWAYYQTENVEETPMDIRFFEVKEIDDATFGETTLKGKELKLRPEYGSLMAGKITLPALDETNDKIDFIGDFTTARNVTEIYSIQEAEYKAILDNAFYMENMNPQLKKITLPDSIMYIGEKAFSECTLLEDINLNDNIIYMGARCFAGKGLTSDRMKVKIDKLPKYLEYLGGYAFYCGGDNITIETIPDFLTALDSYTFAYCPNIRISQFGGGNSKLAKMGTTIFRSSGASDITVLHFEAPVTIPDTDRMFQDGYSGVTTIYTHSLFDAVGNSDAEKIAYLENRLWHDTAGNKANTITTHYLDITG